MLEIHPTFIASSAAVLLVAVGLKFKRQPKRHIPMMLSAFAIDLGLLLYLEFTRNAIDQVTSGFNALLGFHVGVSIGALICYAAMALSGYRLLKGREASRAFHRRIAVVFAVCRLSSYITSYMV